MLLTGLVARVGFIDEWHLDLQEGDAGHQPG
jgi:hypothetical protein